MCQTAESLRGRPELVGILIEEACTKQIDDIALEKQQGQTTFIQAEPVAPTLPPDSGEGDERRAGLLA